MKTMDLTGLDASDPLGFLAAIGLLRVLSIRNIPARLGWKRLGAWTAHLELPHDADPIEATLSDLLRWRDGHSAVQFAVAAAERSRREKKGSAAFKECVKAQDLKHPPEAFREIMKSLSADTEAADFIAAFATGVATDGSGQTKPTSFHFTAGQQRFMDAVLDIRDQVTRDDLKEALFGPWKGRTGVKDLRWRSGSERNRALLSFDPGKLPASCVAGASWLAFQALPLFPVVPQGHRRVTTGFRGRGKHESFAWPVWIDSLSLYEIRTLVGTPNLIKTDAAWREARGVAEVFQSAVIRSTQGYGSFAAADPK